MKIGLLDADLNDGGTNFPNLALMKISAYHKNNGDDVTLILPKSEDKDFDKVYVSKVFTKTKFTNDFKCEVSIGGTGFFYDNAPALPYHIEHIKPDYQLYRDIQGDNYQNLSIGFTTRGCFRKCPFCVNKNYDRVYFHSPVNEFFDDQRKVICLLDDNIFGYSGYESIFNELQDTGHPFIFKQGLDLRLMNVNKAKLLARSRYYKDIYFAFDDYRDVESITNSLKIYREHCGKQARCYCLCGFKSVSMDDVDELIKRMKVLFSFNVLPYVMRFSAVYNSPLKRLYSFIAAWANQPSILKKISFGEFCEIRGAKSKEKFWRVLPKETLNLRWSAQ